MRYLRIRGARFGWQIVLADFEVALRRAPESCESFTDLLWRSTTTILDAPRDSFGVKTTNEDVQGAVCRVKTMVEEIFAVLCGVKRRVEDFVAVCLQCPQKVEDFVVVCFQCPQKVEDSFAVRFARKTTVEDTSGVLCTAKPTIAGTPAEGRRPGTTFGRTPKEGWTAEATSAGSLHLFALSRLNLRRDPSSAAALPAPPKNRRSFAASARRR